MYIFNIKISTKKFMKLIFPLSHKCLIYYVYIFFWALQMSKKGKGHERVNKQL